jgi:hypothetical protein
MNDELLTGEIGRVFGRYRATPVSVEDLAADRRPVRMAVRRPAILRFGVGGVFAAVCLAIVALVFQPFAPTSEPASVFASWRRVPTSPDPAMAGWASSHCTNTKLPLLVQDQRGTASLFVFREGASFVTCIAWTVNSSTEKGWFSAAISGTFDDSAQPIELSSELQADAASDDSVDAAVGQARGASSVVVVTRDGLEMQASVRDGVFAAWWPTHGLIANSNIREIRSYRIDGTLIGDLPIPQSSASPVVLGTPDSSPSGPPLPAKS